jgi:non-lysosomal glucosylceramidase
VQESLEYLRKYDHDGDGIPENDGFPDQTYDVWVVRGASAYCGGLWLAALRAAEEIARTLGDNSAAEKNKELFARSQASYIKKLWNGLVTTPRANITTTYRPTSSPDSGTRR